MQFLTLTLQAIMKKISASKILRNCCVAKKLMSHTFSVKISLEFLEEHFPETVRCIGLKFSAITETVMPFQYSEFF